MKASILYNLFTALRKEERLLAGGIGEFVLLEEQLTQQYDLQNFEDFVFICKLLLVKNKSEQEIFESIVANWKKEIEVYIKKQFEKIDRLKKPAADLVIEQPKTEPAATQNNSTFNPADATANQQQSNGPLDSQGPDRTTTTMSQEEENAEETAESEITISLTDEKAGKPADGKAARPAESKTSSDPDKLFLLGNEYFPVANRSLRQSWRTLKNRQDKNEYGTVDLMATIDEITRTGLFLGFEYQKKTINLLSLFIFIDRGSSMTAFEAFGKELASTAKDSGIHFELKPWYFYEVPDYTGENEARQYWVFNEDETEAMSIAQLFKNLNKKNIVTLVYGDAGALSTASNETLEERKENTIEFLRYLLRRTAYTAWLNPAPSYRWKHTIAETISKKFSEAGMFEATNNGFEQAINALRGKIK